MKKTLKVIVLIMMVVSMAACKGNKKEESKPTDSTPTVSITSKTCTNQIDSNSEYTTVLSMEIVYEEDIAKKNIPSIILTCNSDLVYEGFKNSEEFKEGKEFNDKELTIKYSAGEEVDLTVDGEGAPQTLKLDNYIQSLQRTGYTCE